MNSELLGWWGKTPWNPMEPQFCSETHKLTKQSSTEHNLCIYSHFWMSDVNHIIRWLLCHMHISQLHKQCRNLEVKTENSPMLARLLNTETIFLNILVPILFCGFNSMSHTRQMIELCNTKITGLLTLQDWRNMHTFMPVVTMSYDKRTFCTKDLQIHEYFPIIFLCKLFLLLSHRTKG